MKSFKQFSIGDEVESTEEELAEKYNFDAKDAISARSLKETSSTKEIKKCLLKTS